MSIFFDTLTGDVCSIQSVLTNDQVAHFQKAAHILVEGGEADQDLAIQWQRLKPGEAVQISARCPTGTAWRNLEDLSEYKRSSKGAITTPASEPITIQIQERQDQ